MSGGVRRRGQKHNGCPRTGKIQWTRQDFAERALEKAQAKGKPFVRIYRCPFCLGWHMTSQPARDA